MSTNRPPLSPFINKTNEKVVTTQVLDQNAFKSPDMKLAFVGDKNKAPVTPFKISIVNPLNQLNRQ